ncbi:AraC family transcriptional regulator N-terminal domain-containing protein [Leifsonia sp. LS-T14]|uniref:AraC family transcriptional regulator n=1 Tax=unclassified Leifsonia TaxID=2663824 RepID=UPI0035A5BD90
MAQPGDLRDAIIRHARGGIRRNIVDGLSLGVVTEGTPPAAAMSEPSVTLVAGGRKRTSVGAREFVYGAGEFLVVSIDLPVTGRVERATRDEPFVVLSLTLKPAVIAALLLDTVDVARPPAFTGLAVGTASAALLDAACRMLRLLDDPADLAALGPATEREIVWRLLTGPQGGIVRQIGLADGSIAHISRAIGWMREHVAEPVAIAELARISGMSASTFHRHFRAATSLTPIQWQKALRLREARSRLLTGAAGVAEAGYAVGYGSPSQFSREYRRAFGRPPGVDARSLRNTGGTAAPPDETAWIP